MAVDLLRSGWSAADVARGLEGSDSALYLRRRQDDIERGLIPGLTSAEKAELTAAKRRIHDLETEANAIFEYEVWHTGAADTASSACSARSSSRSEGSSQVA
jgi:hypothetical protein